MIYIKNFISKIILLFLIFSSCSKQKENSFEMPQLFSDGMVIQRDTTVTIWGKYLPNEKIDINCSWGFDTSTFSDSLGYWNAEVKTNFNRDPQNITLSSSKDLFKINDVLIGEVWIAAGQSNMEMTFDYCCNSTDSSSYELRTADFPKIRMYNVKKALSDHPLKDTEGKWISAEGKDIIDFSAAAYFFAKKLHLVLDVPIGIIHASWGSSNIQSWTNKNVLMGLDGFPEKFTTLQKDSLKFKKTKDWYSQFDNKYSGSGAWDLFLSSDILPDIGYFDFFVPGWKELDIIGANEINDFKSDFNDWKELDEKNIIKPILNNSNFSGAVVFKNEFNIDSKNYSLFKVMIEPDADAPFALWEYDIYINGEKVGSSLLDLDEYNYQFNKKNRSYDIDKNFLKIGENTILIRILGYASLGQVKIKNNNKNDVAFLNNWKVKLLAEETLQIDNFKYPYTSFYNYSNKDINFSDIPEKFFLTHNTPSTLYNGMMHPLLNYTIKGLIWYQGESNVGEGGVGHPQYKKIFPLMINDLRKSYGESMPFYYAQLANYFNYGGMLPHFRQIQSEFLNVKNTGMVVTLDIGENYDFHPSNKHDVGNRFALLALNRSYGKNLIDSGPILKAIEKEGKYLNLYFINTGSGIMKIENDMTWFEVAGNDKNYFNAEVDVYKDFIQLFSERVIDPKYVRYAWSDTASATLFNIEGLPGAPFSGEYLKLSDK